LKRQAISRRTDISKNSFQGSISFDCIGGWINLDGRPANGVMSADFAMHVHRLASLDGLDRYSSPKVTNFALHNSLNISHWS